MGFHFIGVSERAPKGGFYRYRKTFTAGADAHLQMRVSSVGRYRLFCNGHAVWNGPVPSPADRLYYDECDLTPYLRTGENELVVEHLFLSVNDERCCTTSRASAKPGIFLAGTLTDETGEHLIGSDETWEVAYDVTASLIPPPFFVLPPNEAIDLEAGELCYEKARITYGSTYENGCFDPYGCIDDFPLFPCPIPREEEEAPCAFRTVRKTAGVTETEEGFRFGKGHHEIELDGGQYLTARVFFTLAASLPASVRITYAEAYRKTAADGTLYKAGRSDTEGVLTGDSDTFRAANGAFDPFSMKTFRFLLLSIDAEEDTFLSRPTYTRLHYPLHPTSFACSNKTYEKMWQVSIDTMLDCMHGVFMDCPYYEQQQYGEDSALQIYYSLHVSNDARLCRKALTDLAASQMPNGLLCSNTPAEYHQCIPGFSLYFIIGLWFYYTYTGDARLPHELSGTVDRILVYFDEHRTESGIVGDCSFWQFTDWAEGWERGIPGSLHYEALTHTSMLYAVALQKAAELFRASGREKTAAEYEARHAALKAAILKTCYDEKAAFFRDCPGRDDFSEHCQYFAVLGHIVEGEEARALIRRTEEAKDRLVRCSFCMQAFRHLAYLECDAPFDLELSLQSFYQMLDLGVTTWFESPVDARSDCHAWSSVIVPLFSERLLGIRVREAGCKAIDVMPMTPVTVDARGELPTPFGNVLVELKDGALFVRAPKDIRLTVHYDGKTEIERF